MNRVSFAVLLVVLVAAACAAPTSQDSPELRARSAEWIAAFQAGDVDTLVGMYTADARVLPPNAEIAQGSEAVREVFGEMVSAGLTGDLTSIEAVVAGDIGYHVGTYTLETQDGTRVDQGKFIELWRLVDGEWKITNDMFNSDLPAAPAAGMTVIATHDVKDGAHWLAAWQGENSRHGLFAASGAPAVRVFQNPQNPKQTALLIEVTDMQAFEAMLASPEGTKAKAEDGVIERTIRLYAEVE